MNAPSLSSTPVVIVHGFPDGPESWNPVATLLRNAGRDVHMAPQLGYGDDRDPDALAQPSALACNVFRAMECAASAAAASPAQQVHLVGHDWGAVAAWLVAGGWAEQAKTTSLCSLTLIGAPHPSQLAAHRASAHGRYARRLGLPWGPALWLRWKGFEPLLAPLRDAGLGETVLERLRSRFEQPDRLRALLAPYRQLRAPHGAEHLHSAMPARMPTLLLRGALDAYVAEAHMTPTRAGDTPHLVETLATSGHWPHIQSPESLSARLLHFWSSVECGSV